mgnify:CR=1 FL=1
MSAHHCHLPGCKAACPPRWLFCKPHWSQVPADVQREVYATVGKRGPYVDATWAPWWRAQAKAQYNVLMKRAADEQNDLISAWAEKRLAKDLAFAATLDAKGGAK